MTANQDRLGVALLAEGQADLVLGSITALGAALDAVERDGAATRAVVVDRTTDAEAAAVVASLEDTPVLRGADGEPAAAALLRAVDALDPEIEHVLLAGTDAMPVEGAFAALLAAARTHDADLTLADASDPAPYALMARRARDVLAAQAAAASDDGVPPVLALARALERAGRPVTTATGAGLRRAAEQFPLPGDSFAQFQLLTKVPEAATIGYGSYFSLGGKVVTYFPHDRIEIGAYCSIADDVSLIHTSGRAYDRSSGEQVDVVVRGDHRPWAATTYPIGILAPADAPYDDPVSDGPLVTRPLRVGNDVWIGSGAMLLGPLTVGDGAIIGAGAVVRRDVQPYEVVIGNPAQTIRRRFDDRTCERLQTLRWWEWGPVTVVGNHGRFSEPVARFLDRFDPAGSLVADAGPDPRGGDALSAVS